jgi:hypothetical protein
VRANQASTAVTRSAVADERRVLIERISNCSLGHLIMDDVTAIVIRRVT